MRADIVIPGRRLWRSTVVMLGSQKADEIFVLPDMNGIVATFKPVMFPSTWSNLDSDFQVPLTVWTSQGSTSLPIPAKFMKPDPTFLKFDDTDKLPHCPLPLIGKDQTGGASQASNAAQSGGATRVRGAGRAATHLP
jgi:hypothetical protein